MLDATHIAVAEGDAVDSTGAKTLGMLAGESESVAKKLSNVPVDMEEAALPPMPKRDDANGAVLDAAGALPSSLLEKPALEEAVGEFPTFTLRRVAGSSWRVAEGDAFTGKDPTSSRATKVVMGTDRA